MENRSRGPHVLARPENSGLVAGNRLRATSWPGRTPSLAWSANDHQVPHSGDSRTPTRSLVLRANHHQFPHSGDVEAYFPR